MSERLTLWLKPSERARLEERAAANGCSMNMIVRLALRRGLGLEIPKWAEKMLDGEPVERRELVA